MSPCLAYRYLGCYEVSEKDIASLEGQSSFLDGSYKTRTNPIEKCINATLSLGYEIFAIKYGGQCRSDHVHLATSIYQRYPPAKNSAECTRDGKGVQVYEITYGMTFSMD